MKTAIAMLLIAVAATAVYLDRAHDPLLASGTPTEPSRALIALPWGAGLPAGAWASSGNLKIRLTFAGAGDERSVVPEIEVLPLNLRFSGVANVAGKLTPLQAERRTVVDITMPGLQNGRLYHWRVRTRDADGGTSPWAGGGEFGISVTPPETPRLVSANATPGLPTNQRTVSLHWSQSWDRTGIAYYQWANSLDPQAEPTWHSTTNTEIHLHTLADGTWYVAVRAVDRAGLVSAPLRWTVTIERTAPTITYLQATSHELSISTPATQVQFSLSRAVHAVLRIQGTSPSTNAAVVDLGTLAAGAQSITWDGKDGAGRYLPSGTYALTVAARDALGNSTVQLLPGVFTLDTRRVVVSLTKQDMTIYDGASVLLHTLITSGGPETQTPVGTFHVLAKYSPYVMRSPWPKSSRLWYPTTTVNYAILFRSGGYFLHDATWRSQFGPGSNAVDGTPGGNTTGTHGCVNVPLGVEGWLYRWVQIGTVVQILA